MRQQKKNPPSNPTEGLSPWRISIWLLVFGGILFFWPSCLDRYLAPRFCYLSAALILAILLVRKDLRLQASAQWLFFDVLLLGWYGLNLASIFWSLSWSEGIFYAQKPLLLFASYWFVRQALLRDASMVYETMSSITLWVTGIVCTILLVQIGMAARQNGLDNETLYDYASGVFGNKSLAGEFLFFLIVFNGIFVLSPEKRTQYSIFRWAILGILFVLILVLQVRTALLATIVGATIYVLVRSLSDPSFRKIARQRILPAGLLTLGLMAALLAWKGFDSPMAKRLNPLNYLESDTANERKFVWYKTDLLNQEHYWLGVGNGSWKFWLPSKSIAGGYRQTEENVIFTRAHNDYLEIRAEMGIIGVVWFCGLFGIALLAAFLTLKNPQTLPESRHKTLLAAVGLIGYCIIQYLDFPRERIEYQLVLAILLALLAQGARDQWVRAGNEFTQKISALLPLLLLPALAFNLLLGWKRMQGEIHNVRVLEAQSRGDWRKVVAESVLAENAFYEYSDTAIPLSWHEGLGWFQLGQFEKSVRAFERAYQLNPWSFQVINNYASALVKAGRLAEAIPLFEKALKINPRYDEGKFNLSYVYTQMADYTRAEEWLSKVDTIKNPGNDIDRAKNKATLKKLAEFQKALQEK